jgi:hypothetical protein
MQGNLKLFFVALTATGTVVGGCKKGLTSATPPAASTTGPSAAPPLPTPTVFLAGTVPNGFVRHAFSTGDATASAPASWSEVASPPKIPEAGTVALAANQRRWSCGLITFDTYGMTLEQVMAQGVQQYKGMAQDVQQDKDAPPPRNAHVVLVEYIKIPAGVAGRFVVDLTAKDGVRMRNYQVVLTRGNRAYMIVGSVPVDEYGAAEPVFDAIAESLELR